MDTATERLERLYKAERARLLRLAPADDPAGEYAAPVFGDGDASAHVMLVGEAPGAEETKLSRPFVGKAGKQLDELLAAAMIPRDEIYLTNAVKYRPVIRSAKSTRNRTPDKKEVAAALPLLCAEVGVIRPHIVVTLGNTPLGAVLSIGGLPKETVGSVHGTAIPISLDGAEICVFPLYHPASGIYNPALVAVMHEDIRLLGRLLRDKG